MINLLKVIVLNWKFVQKEIEVRIQIALDADRPNIFALAQKDILETQSDDINKKAEELAKEKLAKLLSIVDENAIITFSERLKAVFIGGEQVTDPGRLQNLRSEAELLLSTDIWKIVNETPKQLAQRAMFVDDGKIESQLLKGRAILYTLDTQNRILETLKSYSPPNPVAPPKG